MPGAWKAGFKLVSGHKSATVTEAMKVINYIKKKDTRTHKSSGSKNERNKTLVPIRMKSKERLYLLKHPVEQTLNFENIS